MGLMIKDGALKKATTLNDIKPGTVFRGRVRGSITREYYEGIFLRCESGPQHGTPWTVFLSGSNIRNGIPNPIWSTCEVVEDYEEVNAVLEIQ